MERTTDAPACYRHPGRTTRLACSECGRPICPDCVVEAPVGQKCPECAAHEGRGRVVGRAELRARMAGTGLPPVTQALMAISIVVFLLGFASRSLDRELFVQGALYPAAVAAGEWWRLITSAFLHSGMGHVFFNMWALYLFGPPIEREAGSGPFAALYIASALAGSAVYVASGASNPAVGASGAVFGLFGAWLAAALLQRNTVAGRAGLQSLVGLLVINLALPLFIPNIAWQAHLGGLAAGFAISWAWIKMPSRDARLRVAVPAAVAVLSAVLAVLV